MISKYLERSQASTVTDLLIFQDGVLKMTAFVPFTKKKKYTLYVSYKLLSYCVERIAFQLFILILCSGWKKKIFRFYFYFDD